MHDQAYKCPLPAKAYSLFAEYQASGAEMTFTHATASLNGPLSSLGFDLVGRLALSESPRSTSRPLQHSGE